MISASTPYSSSLSDQLLIKPPRNSFMYETPGEPPVSEAPYISSIDLTYCNKITDVGLAHLEKATSINLSSCYNIADEGLAAFQALNPTCTISGIMSQRFLNQSVL